MDLISHGYPRIIADIYQLLTMFQVRYLKFRYIISFNLHNNPLRYRFYYFHFTDEETKNQQGNAIFPRAHS